MSVINKMLKDLEQRDQEHGEEFDPSNSVYQVREKRKLPVLMILLVALILLLAAAVAWLMLDKKALTTSSDIPVNQLSAEVQNTSSDAASSKPQEQTIQQVVNTVPEKTVPEVVNSTTTNSEMTPPVQTTEVTTNPAQNKPVVQLPPAKVEEQVAQAPVNNQEPEMAEEQLTQESLAQEVETVDEQVAPKPAPQPNIPPPQFFIEKSSSKLTVEQRIEKLMAQAQDSFDKGYISDAISQLEDVLSSADNHVEARNLLAVAWYGRGELQQAVTILNDGLNRYPNVEMWRLTAAKIFFKENELSGAFSYLEADLPGASAEYNSMKGTLARQLKRFDKAEVAYTRLTELEPNKGSWWLGHAIALDSQNKSTQAVLSYKQAIEKSGISQASANFALQRINQLQDN